MSNIFAGVKQVGEMITNRRMIRGVRNPFDKATVVSIYPKDFTDVKETLQPREFKINGGTYEKPGITVIDAAGWWLDIDPERPMTEIPVSAVSLAESLIKDYCGALLGVNMSDRMPGVFYTAGEVTLKEVQEKYKIKLAQMKVWQTNWYMELVRLADALWARHNGNPLVIWDEMRLAAREIGAERPWIKNYEMAELAKCFACGSLRNPEYPICPNCKTVDPSHPRAKDVRTVA